MRITLEDLDHAIKTMFYYLGLNFIPGIHDVGSMRHSNMRLIAEKCFMHQVQNSDYADIIREMLFRLEKEGYFRFDDETPGRPHLNHRPES